MSTLLRSRSYRRTATVCVTLSIILTYGGPGFAQTLDVGPIREALERSAAASALSVGSTTVLQATPETVAGVDPVETIGETVSPQMLNPPLRRASPPLPRSRAGKTARQIGAAVIGSIGGMMVGGRVGAALEGKSCACDDPGLKGFLVGAPVGMAIGAVLGVLAIQN